MPITTTCPKCSRKLNVPEALLGKRGKCPKCGENFTIADEEEPSSTSRSRVRPRQAPPPEPDDEEVPDDEEAEDQDEPQEEEERPARKRKKAAEADYEEVPDDEDDEPQSRKRKKKKKRRRGGRDLQPHRGQLIMILGIASIPAFFIGGGITGLGLGIAAWVMGSMDLREMEEGRMDPSGESETNTGRLCGMITTIVGGALAVLGLVFFFCIWGTVFSAILGSASARY
jgi:hypothetical protein